ncbi:hypothetical protein NPIL_444291, partial [Nephila pilipes]
EHIRPNAADDMIRLVVNSIITDMPLYSPKAIRNHFKDDNAINGGYLH